MKNNTSTIAIISTVAIVALGLSFYGGVKVGQKSLMRQGFLGNQKGGQTTRFINKQNDFVNGEILSKDDKSVTVKLINGGSRVILFSDSTEVGKFTSGSVGDLEVGKSIIVNGKTNQDGSLTAQSIQIRPENGAFPGQQQSGPPQE